MTLLDTQPQAIDCPYCGEHLDILIDPADPTTECIEDCQVCCRPITLRIERDEGVTRVVALSEDEY